MEAVNRLTAEELSAKGKARSDKANTGKIRKEVSTAREKGLAWTPYRELADYDGAFYNSCQGCGRSPKQLEKRRGEKMFVSYATKINGRNVVCSSCK